MNAEFQWWLLILGIVIGGSLVYLVLADLQGDQVDEAETDDLALDEPWEDADEPWEDADQLGDDANDETRWSVPAAPIPTGSASAPAGPTSAPAGSPPAPAGPVSARNDAGVQRDGAQGETPVADLK